MGIGVVMETCCTLKECLGHTRRQVQTEAVGKNIQNVPRTAEGTVLKSFAMI